MGKQIEKKKDKMNPFLWFLIAIIIPIVFAIILAYIVFSIAGINVTDWAKEKATSVPVISSFVTTDEEKDLKPSNKNLKASLSDKDNEIERLTEEIGNLEGTIDQLEKDLLKSEKRSSDSESDRDETKQEETGLSIKQISSSFKDMKADQAALIMQKLDTDTASALLKTMPNKVRGSILEAMDPEQAADLTKLIINE